MIGRRRHREPRHALRIKKRGAGTRRDSGFALVLVLGFALIVTLTGFAMLEGSATQMPQAVNMRAAARAKDMAASGVALATHYLRVPPTTVAIGNYWSGVTGFSVDGTTDTVDVSIAHSSTTADMYSVTSVGTVRDPDGTIRGRKTISTEVITPPPFTWKFTQACVNSGNVTLNKFLEFYGNVHANGNINSQAYASGRVSATGTVSWSNAIPPQSISTNVSAVLMPSLSVTAWNRYVLFGMVRAATPHGNNTLSAVTLATAGATSCTAVYTPDGSVVMIDPLSLLNRSTLGDKVTVATSALGISGTSRSGYSVISASNPGGVIVITGDTTIAAGTSIIGTLVIDGRLKLPTIGSFSISAMPGFPALVIADKIDGTGVCSLDICGPVLVGNRFEGDKMLITHSGVILNYGSGFEANLGKNANVKFTFDSNFTKYYDFLASTFQPMTLLKWSE